MGVWVAWTPKKESWEIWSLCLGLENAGLRTPVEWKCETVDPDWMLEGASWPIHSITFDAPKPSEAGTTQSVVFLLQIRRLKLRDLEITAALGHLDLELFSLPSQCMMPENIPG